MCVSCHCFSSVSKGKAIEGCGCGCHQPPQPEAPTRIWIAQQDSKSNVWSPALPNSRGAIEFVRADLAAERPVDSLPEYGAPHADGRYCIHHDDDPAHGNECYERPADEDERVKEIRERRQRIDDWVRPWPDYSGAEDALYQHAMRWKEESTWMGRTRPSAEFISHAPTDIDYLLSLLDRQQVSRSESVGE